jgi:hypothetical protein
VGWGVERQGGERERERERGWEGRKGGWGGSKPFSA